MVDGRHTLLFDAEDIDDIAPCLFAHRDDVVGVACRCPVLLAVEHTVDGLVELRVADERQVVYRDHRPDALGTVQPDGELVGQAVEEVDLLVTAARRHREVAPDIPTSEGQSTVRRDETHRAMRQQTLVERRVARGRGEKEIAVLRSELGERVQHEATVIAEASGIVRNALGIEGDIHRQVGDEGSSWERGVPLGSSLGLVAEENGEEHSYHGRVASEDVPARAPAREDSRRLRLRRYEVIDHGLRA